MFPERTHLYRTPEGPLVVHADAVVLGAPTGSTTKVVYQAGWNLTRLKRIGLTENRQRGALVIKGSTESDSPGSAD